MTTMTEQFRELETLQFSSGSVHVLFAPETLQLFRLNEQASESLAEIRDGRSVEEVCTERGLRPDALEAFLRGVVDAVHAAPPAARPNSGSDVDTFFGPVLPKLVFMVNNYCNLACSYCYEHDTVFKERATVMSHETVDAALESFHQAFRGFGELMFIGGEPTLSEEVIEYACERSLAEAERGGRDVSFSMITNGARLTEKMFEIIDRFDVQVTFSVDGPKEVQDAERVFRGGAGSFDKVMVTIGRYREKHANKLGVECTLTKTQARKGVTVSDLSRFFADEVGVSAPHIAAAGLQPGNPLDPWEGEPPKLEAEFEEAAARAMDELLEELATPGGRGRTRAGLDLVSGMVKKLIRRRASLQMCPAGTSQLVVDPHGDVYPCWMFAGMPSFRMGNVARDEVFNGVATRILQRILDNDRTRNPQCSKCYARYVCNVCLGNNQNGTGKMEQIDERYCNTVRRTLRTVLVKLGEAQADSARWKAVRERATSSQELEDEGSVC